MDMHAKVLTPKERVEQLLDEHMEPEVPCVIRWMEDGGPPMQSHLDAETRNMQRLFSIGLAESQRLIHEEALGVVDEERQVY